MSKKRKDIIYIPNQEEKNPAGKYRKWWCSVNGLNPEQDKQKELEYKLRNNPK